KNANSEHFEIIVSGGAEFKALTFFTATVTGTVTFDFQITDQKLVIDMNGSVDATYLGNLGQAAGHFTIDFNGGSEEIPIVYGALVLQTGSAFNKLDSIGIHTTANAWFYVNTDSDSAGHDVPLTFTDQSTQSVHLNPLSAGMGAYGILTWK